LITRLGVALGFAVAFGTFACAPAVQKAGAPAVPKAGTFPEASWLWNKPSRVEVSSILLDELAYYPLNQPPPADEGYCRKRFVSPRVFGHKQQGADGPTVAFVWGIVNSCEAITKPTPTPMPVAAEGQREGNAPAKVSTDTAKDACTTATIKLSQWQFAPENTLDKEKRSWPEKGARNVEDISALFDVNACRGGEKFAVSATTLQVDVRRHDTSWIGCLLSPKAEKGLYRYMVEFWACGDKIENRDPIIDIGE